MGVQMILIFAVVCILQSPAMGLMSCRKGQGCPMGTFCYEMRACAPCLQCSSVGRSPDERMRCAMTTEDCGDCLEGYEEDIRTVGSPKTPCRKLASEMEISEENPTNWHAEILYCSLSFSLVVLLSAGVLFYYLWKRSGGVFLRALEKFPRVCSWSNASTAPGYGDGALGQEHVQLRSTAPFYEAESVCAENFKQKAAVFQAPCYIKTPPQGEEPMMQDEDTMPSSWAPTGESSAQVPTDFRNFISIQNGRRTDPDCSVASRPATPPPTNPGADQCEGGGATPPPQPSGATLNVNQSAVYNLNVIQNTGNIMHIDRLNLNA